MIEIVEDKMDVDTYLNLRKSVGFKLYSRDQAQRALANSMYIVTAYQNGDPVGMGRIVGDGAVICYVQDLIVHPHAQGQGVGGLILETLKKFVINIGLDDTTMMFCLMCAKGREAFYEKHGFIARPTDSLGPGMISYLDL